MFRRNARMPHHMELSTGTSNVEHEEVTNEELETYMEETDRRIKEENEKVVCYIKEVI